MSIKAFISVHHEIIKRPGADGDDADEPEMVSGVIDFLYWNGCRKRGGRGGNEAGQKATVSVISPDLLGKNSASEKWFEVIVR